MKKVKLEIVGLSYSQTQSGAYALVLGEVNGRRRLPIIIGSYEAQSIAIEIEKMNPARPLTHDLFRSFAKAYQVEINEILIYNLVEGVFFAKLICNRNGEIVEIDARTSDAVAIAVRFNAMIYTYEFILSSAGIIMDSNDFLFLENMEGLPSGSPVENEIQNLHKSVATENYQQSTLSELKIKLEEALAKENYEKAAKIRDEINKRNAGK